MLPSAAPPPSIATGAPSSASPISVGAPTVAVEADDGLILPDDGFILEDPNPGPAPLIESDPAAPIAGGTLRVTSDGRYALAADPDRDRLYRVNLETREVASIHVEPGDELGRIAEGDAATFVVARRGGVVIAVDVESASVIARIPVCPAPRGVAVDRGRDWVHVACQSGRLVSLSATSFETERVLELERDLRDVLVHDEQLVVTRFRAAELLVVDADGEVLHRAAPPDIDGTVAYRAVKSDGGDVVMVHQHSTTRRLNTVYYGPSVNESSVVPVLTHTDVARLSRFDRVGIATTIEDPGASLTTGSTVPTHSMPYLPNGESWTGGNPTTISVDAPPDGTLLQSPPEPPSDPAFTSTRIAGATGPFDVALAPDGRIGMVFTGTSWNPSRPNLWLTERTFAEGHDDGLAAGTYVRIAGEATSIAFDGDGRYIVQSRQPARLDFEDGSHVVLDEEPRSNTGFQLFYQTVGVGISCASCHPEGDEDGHVWAFSVGLRRTQPLGGGITRRAPYHWDGEFATLPDLANTVFTRMGMTTRLGATEIAALGNWLDTIAAPSAMSADPAATERGRELFFDTTVACSRCHSGEAFTDNRPYDVGTGATLITPTLLGIGSRSVFMHDGCAGTLEERFGPCGGGDLHGVTSHLSDAQIADLMEFLKTL